MQHITERPWNLVADIGGTNARFGVEDYASGALRAIKCYSVADYPEFQGALYRFLADVAEEGGWRPRPRAACLALACVVDSATIRFTNSSWVVDRREIDAVLGGGALTLLNDFAAVGYAISDLKPADWHQVGGTTPDPGKTVAVLGPGTGLGVCSLVPLDAGHRVIEGEGGHVDFAPVGEREVALLARLTARFGRVSVERLLSGAGIVNIYRALCDIAGQVPVLDDPAGITAAALAGEERLAVDTLDMFCEILGGCAGNLALILGARGGVYIAGGIVPRFIDFVVASGFRRRFEAKGRFRDYLADVPVRIVTREHLGLLGAARKLNLLE